MSVVAVIDDEAIICDLVEACLSDAGMEVHTATTAERGAAMLANRHFDLALIDVLLADESGILLAQIAANQNTPVLLMTGHSETASRLRQFDFPHMMKPFDTSRLADEAARVIAARHETVQRMADGLARLQANLAGFDIDTGITRRLLARSREIVARAEKQGTDPVPWLAADPDSAG